MRKKSLSIFLVVTLIIGTVWVGASLVGRLIPDKETLQAAEVRTGEVEDRTTVETPGEQDDTIGKESPSEGSEQDPAGKAADPAALGDRLLLIDGQGDVEIGVTLENPIQDDEAYLVFKTQLNTHSVDLDGYDYEKLATLRTSEGLKISKGILWERPEGDIHHFIGYYKVPRIIDGKNVVTKDTTYLELRITGIDNVEDRTFRWEKDVLDLIPAI
ncbi:MAG TPA: hypothetical protein VLN47_03585 [Clostridiaceae bacterium]|nr:hypothetical protein [Clostridiaceae bacterium]